MSSTENVLRFEPLGKIGYVPSIYVKGNVLMPTYPDAESDNWRLWVDYFDLTPLPLSYRRHEPLKDLGPYPVTVQNAYDAYSDVTADVGANARLDSLGNWVSNPDTVDQRYISDVQNGTGPASRSQLPERPEDVGGYPHIDPGTPYSDSDHDGMADAWEKKYGFNPAKALDGPKDADRDGYTNIEEFLNGTDPHKVGTSPDSDK